MSGKKIVAYIEADPELRKRFKALAEPTWPDVEISMFVSCYNFQVFQHELGRAGRAVDEIILGPSVGAPRSPR